MDGAATAVEEVHSETPRSTPHQWSRGSTPTPGAGFNAYARHQESFQETQFDSTQESQLSVEHEGKRENEMNLTAADIERWIDGSGTINVLPTTSSASNQTMGDATPLSQSLPICRFSGAMHPSRASWTSCKSNSTCAAEKLLRSSMQALYELEKAMLNHEYVMIVQVAGVPGVCHALVKSLTKLKAT
jgi:hypothetical protein